MRDSKMELLTKDIEGFEGLYTIDSFGRVFSKKRNRFYHGKTTKNGYMYITLSDEDGGQKQIFSIHRLVAFHFLKKIDKKIQVNHIDGIKTNNLLINLEWVTASENVLHSYSNGREGSFKYSKYQRDMAVKLRGENRTFKEIAIITGCSEIAAKRAVYANNKLNNAI